VRILTHLLLGCDVGHTEGQCKADALHIARAVVNGMEDCLRWNCTPIANAALRSSIAAAYHSAGFDVPLICTPEAFLEA
jgi:uncharacterized protein (DUF2267 family)